MDFSDLLLIFELFRVFFGFEQKIKLLRLLLKVTEATTDHQKGLKFWPNRFTKKTIFLPEKKGLA